MYTVHCIIYTYMYVVKFMITLSKVHVADYSYITKLQKKRSNNSFSKQCKLSSLEQRCIINSSRTVLYTCTLAASTCTLYMTDVQYFTVHKLRIA